MQRWKFTLDEVKKLTQSMIILVDTREKANGHILEYFETHNIPYKRAKLDYGDYSFMIPAEAAGQDIFFHRSIVIERKASLDEISGNLTKDRERFEREFLRAGNDGCKVYLMIEQVGGYSDIIAHRYRTQFSPTAFMASMKTWESRFDANIQFILPQYAGYYIVSTFQYFAREMLK